MCSSDLCSATAGGTLDVTPIVWNQFSQANTYSAGSGLQLVGSQFSLSSPVSVSNGGTGVTTITGILKGNGSSAFTVAVAGTDYSPATTGSSILKGNGAGGFSIAIAGTDYQTAQPVTGIVKSSGVTRSAAVAGTDYAVPTTGSNSQLLANNGSGGFSNVNVGSGLLYSGGTLTATGGGGSGTVTSVGLTMPSGFSVSGSPVTGSGTLSVTTSLNGIIKGTGSAFTAAVAGTDYSPATTGISSQLLANNGYGGFSNVNIGSGLLFSGGTLTTTGGTTGTSILQGNGSGGFANVTVAGGLQFGSGYLGTATGLDNTKLLACNGLNAFTPVTVGSGLSYNPATSTLTLSGSGSSIYYNVQTYGASPSASAATNTTAFQNAINAAAAAGGGTVFIPTGTYLVSGPINITSNGIKILGASGSGSNVKQSVNGSDTFVFSGTLDSCEISSLIITSTVPDAGLLTGGAAIKFTACLFTGSISGTTLTVTSVSQGVLRPGVRFEQSVNPAYPAVTIAPGTTITGYGTGTGGTGTYTINNSQTTASTSLVSQGPIECFAYNFYVFGCYTGVEIIAGNAIVNDFNINGYKYAGIRIHSTEAYQVAASAQINNFNLSAAYTVLGQLGGIRMLGRVEALQVSNGDILVGQYSMTADSIYNAVGYRPAYNQFTNIYFNAGYAGGVDIRKSTENTFVNCDFAAGYPTSAYPSAPIANGLNMIDCAGTRFVACRFAGCNGNGAYVDSSNNTTLFDGCQFISNNLYNRGTYYGVNFANGAHNFIVQGCFAYNNEGFGYQTGMLIGSSCNNFIVANNLFTGSGGGITNNAGTSATQIVANNIT